jgi:hypothetical protein
MHTDEHGFGKSKSKVKNLNTENTEVTEGTENSQRNYGRKEFVLSEILPQPDSYDRVIPVSHANLLSLALSVFICVHPWFQTRLTGLPLTGALALQAVRGGAQGIGDVFIGRQDFEVLGSDDGEQVQRNLERRLGIVY